MDDRRWIQIESVYLAALDAPDRAAYLGEVCRDDPELRTAVDLLLNQEPSTVSLIGPLALTNLGAALPSLTGRTLLAPDSELGLYRIVELLGSGGSSDVYKAYDTRLDRNVALKVFDETHVTEEFRSRFARESRVAASLNHPNIATVYKVGEADGCWFIAMEYVDGMTLRAAFGDPTCSLKQRLEYLAQAAGGLARAHTNGIAHCDLKPDNIMVTRDGLVKVLDFGLARLSGSSDVAAEPRFEGTIGYMSPEQAAGETIDARSDVFSFGCILFEAAVGQLPFPPGPRWVERLIHAPPPRLETATPGVPEGLEALIDECLVKDPAARLPSLEEVSQRLQLMLDHRPSRISPWVLAAIALAALAIPALAYWQWPAQPPAGSVAVIRFVSVEQTPDRQRLAEGISEGVINALAQLPDLKVIARSSSFRFGGDSLDVAEVARTLDVQTLVTGRVAVDNGQVSISTELVSGRDGTVMWSAEYSPSLAGITDIEAQIAREIARRVRSELTPADKRRLDRAVHPNAEAYSLLLRGRYEMSLYTPEISRRAVRSFQEALGIDPAYRARARGARKCLSPPGNLRQP